MRFEDLLGVGSRPLRVLDFDIENRPLSYWYDDKTTAEITAIAWSLYGEDEVTVKVLEPPPHHEVSMMDMLVRFKTAYDEADMVTGHFIRVHDLPTIQGHMIEFGLEPLGAKLTSDTKLDMIRRTNMSASQKALADMLDVRQQKVAMPQQRWRDANRLTIQGRQSAIERVTGDVRQHKALRLEMLKRGLLNEPRIWVP